MIKKITIEKNKLDALKQAIRKINRIEKKQGMKQISKILKEGNIREKLKVYYINDYEYSRKVIDTIYVIDIELFISEEKRTQEEYNILARIDKVTNEENHIIIYDEKIYNKYTLDELIKIKIQCEHCNMKRARKTSYIIENMKTKEVKQIGKTCLIEYTTQKNILNYLDYLESISELENIIEYYTRENLTNNDFQGQLYNILDIIAASFVSIEKRGFISKYNATKDNISTKDDTLNILLYDRENFNFDDIKEKIKWYLSIDKAKYINDYIKNDNNFVFKLEKLLQYEYTTEKNISTLVCFPIAYQQLKKKVKNKENEESTKEKIKELTYKENDKIELNNLTLTSNKKYQNEKYNTTTTYYYFLDNNDITYLWKSSRIIDILENTKEKINLKGTVKKIDDNKIVLTRCKVI